ncbi:MFS transporter [Pseudomonadales bacterium]|nr:MFS transporter [Pseudomonadales bacterium]
MSTSPHWYRWILLAGVWAMYCSFGLIVTSLAPLVGLIESDLDISHSAMGSVMGAWQLIFIISAIPCGILLDKVSTRSALTLGGLIIAASALARGFADSYAMLMIAVMLFGVGGPIISTGAPKVVTQHFAGQSRGLAMGIYMTGPSIGGVVSLTLTHSVLVPFFDDSWRAVMFLWAGFAAGVSILWWLLTTINPIPKTQEDIHLGTLEAATAPLKQTQIIMNLLRQPSVVLVLLMGIGVFMFNHGLMNWLPALLEEGGLSEVDSGYWAAIPTVVGIAGSLLIPRLATPERRYHILIALTLCAALASVLLQFSPDLPKITGLVMQGIARSSLMTVLILTLLELPAVGEKYAGVASGLFFTAAEVGGVLGPISLGILYDVSGGFSAGLYLLSSISLLIAISAMALKRTSTSAQNS